ncbi:putative fatty acid desaturase [Sorangium cellulosum So ce56]|uniref:Fatty acid desaturase n=2 Tax=Polyangiaceae TaxID=49 RepID=A9GRP1_SORC5|nr:putative fatty acid desaturase [Sorangium cellulosum So ce56]
MVGEMDLLDNKTIISASSPAEREHHIRSLLPELKAAGTFQPATSYHVIWFLTVFCIYAGSYAVLLTDPGWPPRTAAIVIVAVMMMQLGLFAHEVGHGAITTHMRWRSAMGLVSNSLLVGFSYSYWQSTHSRHHNHPNAEGIDPDMESLGYALYERAAQRSRGLPRVVARLQPFSVWVGFIAWGAAIKIDGMIYLVRNLGRRTAADVGCIVAHFVLWLVVPMTVVSPRTALINYASMTVLNGLYMAAILVVPHVGTGTQAPDQQLPFFVRQVRYSRNYDSSWLGTLLCGGLNLQIEHHLLPHVPCMRLRRAKPIIASYCIKHGLPYEQVSYWEAWRQVLAHLRRMSLIVRGEDRIDTTLTPASRRAA